MTLNPIPAARRGRRAGVAACVAVLLLVGAVGPAAAQGRSSRVPPGTAGGRVVFEAGVALPGGDLADDFNATPGGFSAGAGLEVGFQWRLPVSRRLAVSPEFHFTNYRDLLGDDPQAPNYRLQCSTLRYGLELMWTDLPENERLRPFVAAGASYNRNRYQGFTKDFSEPLNDSVSALGLTLRAGVRVRGLELSAGYHWNRFSTWRFFAEDEQQDVNWDTLIIRGGWVLPLK